MSQQMQKNSYKPTLNLPKTRFSMKANLVQQEPATIRRWEQQKIYEELRRRCAGRPRYVFHDGPPYANGSIHLGHLLNKVLKDLVVRTKTMAGFDCPYVPGWDCHGLPIEHKVLQKLGEKAAGMHPMQIRKRCHDYAQKYVKLQSDQFRRLLTLADYNHPYLTMEPDYEAATLDVFAELVARRLVYRDVKPVHWSIANRTALAEAELEYETREDTSVYVFFEIEDGSRLPASLAAPARTPVFLMIWTTTPWTLPANLAVAVHQRYEYGLYRFEHGGKTRHAILACEPAAKVLTTGGTEPVEPLGTTAGRELLGLTYRHPFVEGYAKRPVVAADYVTLEDGTGLVHTAPGHGVEDYQTGMKEGLDIYCPVQEDGTFDDTAPDWLRGKDIWGANGLIVDRLEQSGHLFHQHRFEHSYPHDWRSKTPVIFRATEQWFLGVDKSLPEAGAASLREMAMTATASQIRFIPQWGRNRMHGMLESRPDWCLSRQRAWGLPIPAFFSEDGKQYLLTHRSVTAVAAKVRQQGSDYWFNADPSELLADYDPACDSEAPDWLKQQGRGNIGRLRKSSDIFDVWFESGSSWNAVIRRRFGNDHYPTDLYLEGSDQHRGWFQVSLLPALALTGQSPFRSVLTHGFMVDKNGRKMSKSLGNTLEVEQLFKTYGADVCRWWVCSLNPDNDIKADDGFFKLAGEEYRKVRNTLRFLLGNLADFDSESNRHSFSDADATSLDAWALDQLAKLTTKVRQAYDDLQFRMATEAVYQFCNQTTSAIYLAAVKDRLYCDRADSPRRRRCQTAIFDIADALIRLIGAILPHTADEAWCALHGDEVKSVHLSMLPEARPVPVDENWPAVITAREQWLKAIEQVRQQRGLENPLDCGLQVDATDGLLTKFDPVDLADLCGISRFEWASAVPSPQVTDLRKEPRCERSWKRDGTVKRRSDDGMLSDRDAAAVGV